MKRFGRTGESEGRGESDEDREEVAPPAQPRARARGETSTRRARIRAILNRLGEPGVRFDDDLAAELAEEHGVGVTQIRVDVGDVNLFLSLGDEVGGMRPFLIANLASSIVDAKERGRGGDVARLAEVLGKTTGDIAPAQVNTYIDARTGQPKPELARALDEVRVAQLDWAREAARRLGIGAETWDATYAAVVAASPALAAEMDAPGLLASGGG